jgi:ATP-dependent Clp protease protease subunit
VADEGTPIDGELLSTSDYPLTAEEVRCIEAEADEHSALAAKARAETRLQNAMADVAEIELRRQQLDERISLAANFHHHVYVFDQEVGEKSVKACIQQLQVWSRNDPRCDVEIQINSPGGSIFDGFALIDFIRDLRDKGHKVTLVGIGMVASMAAVVLQAGDNRILGKHATLLIHEGSMGAFGNFGEVEDRVKLMEMFHERILDLFAERSNLSKSTIRKNWKRRDWWIDSSDALKHGLVDEVR